MGVFKQAGLQHDAWAALPAEPFERDDIGVLPEEPAPAPDIVVNPETSDVVEITVDLASLTSPAVTTEASSA